MIDVIEEIKPLLEFNSGDDFYYLQILQRKKENPQLGSNSRVIKNYYINNLEYLESRYPEIKELCTQFNARAMLRLNKRSYEKVAFKAMQNIANTMSNGEFAFVPKSYDRACGNGHNDKNKKWIIDIDGDDVTWVDEIITSIEKCMPNPGINKVLLRLPTKNGIHLITAPFNIKEYQEYLADIMDKYQMSSLELDIHKDNPINLYIP